MQRRLLSRRLATAAHTTNAVCVVEVGPRDGLQNESMHVPTQVKLDLISRLSKTGLTVIEATSFVSKKHVPQLADAAQVLQELRNSAVLNSPSVRYPVLVPTERHLRLAIETGAQEVAIFASASEGFSRGNLNCTIAESIARFRPLVRTALESGLRVRGYMSCFIACPYDGRTHPESFAALACQMLEMGCYEISLGDTIGVGTPGTLKVLLEHLLRFVPPDRLAGHYHDTYGQALANVFVSLDMGLRVFDSSVGGLGDCPFAKGASGNLATEDLVYMLHGSGYETGINLSELSSIGNWISGLLGRQNQSRAGKAFSTSTDYATCPKLEILVLLYRSSSDSAGKASCIFIVLVTVLQMLMPSPFYANADADATRRMYRNVFAIIP